MREVYVSLDSSGNARDVGGRAHGFRLVPSRQVGALVTSRPGSYPIRVTTDTGQQFDVSSDESRLLAEPFNWLQLTGGESGDGWRVQLFEARHEAVFPAGQRSTVAVQVQAATACPTAAPSGTDGFKVRPGTRAHTFYAGGTATTARLWVRSAGGTWVDTGEDLDFAANAAQSRVVTNSADRVYLKAAASGMTIEIDSEVEVG